MENILKVSFLFITLLVSTFCLNAQTAEKDFKRFEWKSSSNSILNNEKLTLKEKKLNDYDKDYEITYYAKIAYIPFELRYNLKFDELYSIVLAPIRPHPKAKDFITHTNADFQTIYNEYITIQKKLLPLIGSKFQECINTQFVFCADDWQYLNDSSFVINENYYETKKNIEYVIKNNDFNYGSFVISHRWKNTENNTFYYLVMQCNGDLGWNWFLNMSPIKK